MGGKETGAAIAVRRAVTAERVRYTLDDLNRLWF